MLIELLEDDETALIAVIQSYRKAVLARGLDCDISPATLVSSLIRREAETVSRPGHALFEFHPTGRPN